MSEGVAARRDSSEDAAAAAGQLLPRLYREIGLAAVAAELDIALDDLGARLETARSAEGCELAA